MKWCDSNDNVVEWASEEVVIPYVFAAEHNRASGASPKVRRYFVDFYIKVKNKNGGIDKYLIEIKPKSQTLPPKKGSRVTKSYINSLHEFMKNQAKWSTAERFCNERGLKFKVLTEDDLGIAK